MSRSPRRFSERLSAEPHGLRALRSRSRRLGCLLLIVVASAFSVGCKSDVTRISNGLTRQERPISAEAYAAFGRARWSERGGDTSGAIAAYREVLNHDGDSDEAYVRIGALSCTRDPTLAARAFADAATRNPASADLYQAKARCALYHRKLDEATAAAEQALRLAPTDAEVSHLLIDVHVGAGRHEEALRCAWAHVAVFSDDTPGWQRLAELVRPNSALSAQIRRRGTKRASAHLTYSVMPLTSAARGVPTRLDVSPAAELDLEDALAIGDVHAIHRAARQLGLSTVDLMDRATQFGAFEFARSQAKLAGTIDPDNLHVWLVRLQLADLMGDGDEFAELLERAPAMREDQKNVDFSVLWEIVERRTGVQVVTSGKGR